MPVPTMVASASGELRTRSGKARRQSLGKAEDATLGVGDVLAEQDTSGTRESASPSATVSAPAIVFRVVQREQQRMSVAVGGTGQIGKCASARGAARPRRARGVVGLAGRGVAHRGDFRGAQVAARPCVPARRDRPGRATASPRSPSAERYIRWSSLFVCEARRSSRPKGRRAFAPPRPPRSRLAG